MRTRRALLLALVVTLAVLPMAAAPMVAAAGQAILAQGDVDEDERGDPVGEEDAPLPGEEIGEEGSGARDPEAETGPGEAEEVEGAEGGEAAEEGPVWTYQMARIGLVLVLLLLAAVAFTYWAFVGRRQKVEG